MTRAVSRLVSDYARRTPEVWLLVAGVEIVQTSIFWAQRSEHLPFIGCVIAAMAFPITFASSLGLMSTLPVRRGEIVRVRWWAQIGLPALVVSVAIALSWLANLAWGFPVPPLSHLASAILGSVAILALLSALPLPTPNRSGSNLTQFAGTWSLLGTGALFGYPIGWMPKVVTAGLGACGVLVAIARFLRAGSATHTGLSALHSAQWHGRAERSARSVSLHGWSVLFVQLLQSTLWLCLLATLGGTVLRRLVPALDLPQLTSVLPVLFVSATGICCSLVARRCLRALPALQCLPISTHRLALVLCAIPLLPALAACAVATLVHSWLPSLGVAIPIYVLPVFAIVPPLSAAWTRAASSHAVATHISRWAAILQLATWPLWAGSFGALALTNLLPPWFGPLAIVLTIASAPIGYVMMRARIRAGYAD